MTIHLLRHQIFIEHLLCARDSCSEHQRYNSEKTKAFGFVKINKRKLHLEGSQEPGRGNSHHLPLFHNCRPNWKRGDLACGYYFTIPAGGRKISVSPGNRPANERQLQLSQ